MAKLTKAQAKAHTQACDLIHSDTPLNDDQKEFILNNWNEAATSLNTNSGAHFTPLDMASDVALEVCSDSTLLDLCAGIGVLGLSAVWRGRVKESDLTLIEYDPAYITVGKRLLPNANWIQADAFTLPDLNLGRFDTIISNPPFGSQVKISKKPPRYTGAEFDLAIIDLAADYTDHGVFILPANHSPFLYSGQRYFRPNPATKIKKFMEQTGHQLDCGLGIDTSIYRDDWKTTSIVCEVVVLYKD